MHQKSSAWFKAYPTAAGKKFRKRGSGPATKAVDLYPNRLVIWNLGELPPGIRIGDLKREHPSMPRNPDITQELYLPQYMERVGRGTQNIVKWCKQAGLPQPKWSVDASGITLTL